MLESNMTSQLLFLFLVGINAVCYALFALDKGFSQRGEGRISEKNLFLTALLGGAAGGLLGMYLYHHKTRHLKFTVGMPLILAAHIAFMIWYFSQR